jgi:GNAT superfamily N-acetyltransferase
MREEVAATSAERMPAWLTFAEIEPDEARLVAALPCRPFSLEYVIRRMKDAKCFAAFRDGELVGYTWCYYSHVPAASGRDVLFELDDNGAYVFDMYVARLHRGNRIAVALRRWTNSELARRGRQNIYSTTLAHNSSAMRFKERLGAGPIEKRLGYGVKHVFGRDVRVKAFVEGPLPTKPSIALRHWARTASGIT